MKNHTRVRSWTQRISGATLVFVVAFAAACASTDVTWGRRDLSQSNLDLTRVGRVLLAGFVPVGTEQIDLNRETARLLKRQLRHESVHVIESDPLRLTDVSRSHEHGSQALGVKSPQFDRDPSEHVSASHADDAVFTNVPFWRRLGEEYGAPLILTGTVSFNPVAPRRQRTVLRRAMLPPLRGFRLELRLIFISGTTGEIIDSVALPPRTAHAASGRESALSLYFQLMDEMMPSILAALEQQASHRSNSSALANHRREHRSGTSPQGVTIATREAGVLDD
ncbi:MAG: hypothetical protein ACRD2X_14595 [Vicinamibacteraceae bacterium]